MTAKSAGGRGTASRECLGGRDPSAQTPPAPGASAGPSRHQHTFVQVLGGLMCCTFKSNLTKRLLKVLSVTPVLWSLLMGEGAEPLLGLYTISRHRQLCPRELRKAECSLTGPLLAGVSEIKIAPSHASPRPHPLPCQALHRTPPCSSHSPVPRRLAPWNQPACLLEP